MIDGVYIIGREPTATPIGRKRPIRIGDPTVSKQHAELTILLGTYHLRDNGSRNGLWKKGRKGPRRFHDDYVDPHETIWIGNYATTVAELLAHRETEAA